MNNKVQSREEEQEYQFGLHQQTERLKANLLILEILKNYFIKNPDYRFGQGLYNLNIATHVVNHTNESGTYYKDIFFEESVSLRDRLDPTLWEYSESPKDPFYYKANLDPILATIPTEVDLPIIEE